jgi:hypothetical protein
MATELGRYLRIDATTFSQPSTGPSEDEALSDEPSVHEQALAAILDGITSNFNTTVHYDRIPEPVGGVQEWWARMLGGTETNPQSKSGLTDTDESR